MQFKIYDHRGRPIPPGEIREEAVAKSHEFIDKHKEKFAQWLRFFGNGPVAPRPPITYDVSAKKWFWDEKLEKETIRFHRKEE